MNSDPGSTRTVLAEWLGTATNSEAVANMAAKYARLCRIWDSARAGVQEEVA